MDERRREKDKETTLNGKGAMKEGQKVRRKQTGNITQRKNDDGRNK